MMNDPFFLVVAGAMLLVVLILLLGLASFARGGKDEGKRSSRLMQARVVAQFVAILLIVAFVAYRRYVG
jgi:preprotein translocase subunit SecG